MDLDVAIEDNNYDEFYERLLEDLGSDSEGDSEETGCIVNLDDAIYGMFLEDVVSDWEGDFEEMDSMDEDSSTFNSSSNLKKSADKWMKKHLKPGQEIELCNQLLDRCAEVRSRVDVERYGHVADIICKKNNIYVTLFEQIFKNSYDTIDRLDTRDKLRNVSEFFATLLFLDSISWEVFSCIKLNEEDTTITSKEFIKFWLQELFRCFGLYTLNRRLKVVTLQQAIEGLFPRDDPKNTRFAINFFTSIGLDGLTDELREHLNSLDKENGGAESMDEDSSVEKNGGTERGSEEEVIVDSTKTDLIALRRTIYFTIRSTTQGYKECAQKLMKIQLKSGQEIEICNGLLDYCTEVTISLSLYASLADELCKINNIYVTLFEQTFKDFYDTIRRLDTYNRLRNVSEFFVTLLCKGSISWKVFSCIKLNKEDTTSSKREFIKFLFQELSKFFGFDGLKRYLKNKTKQQYLEGLFPRDDPKNTRFAINFFTSFGFGKLTNELQEHLKSRPEPVVPP